MNLGGDTVTVITRTAVLDGNGKPVKNAHGKPVRTETEFDVPGCSFENIAGLESQSNIDESELWARVFLPPAVTPAVVDAIRFAGLVYEVTEPARLWTDEFGRPDHVLVHCKQFRG